MNPISGEEDGVSQGQLSLMAWSMSAYGAQLASQGHHSRTWRRALSATSVRVVWFCTSDEAMPDKANASPPMTAKPTIAAATRNLMTASSTAYGHHGYVYAGPRIMPERLGGVKEGAAQEEGSPALPDPPSPGVPRACDEDDQAADQSRVRVTLPNI